MGFFITSAGIGNGDNLGGLAGADAHCTKLAEAPGSTGSMWRAYLSAQAGQSDRRGLSARGSRGSGQEDLIKTGGAELLYCFAKRFALAG